MRLFIHALNSFTICCHSKFCKPLRFLAHQSNSLASSNDILLLGFEEGCSLTKETDMATVVKAMAQQDSGLQICDRMWLKITIPNSFIGL